MEAAAAMDFHALSRRELQALCKRNGVRANMTNAAMAEALQGLSSVDGIDEIGTTLCLPTPGRSVMKSAAKMAEMAEEEQQHGSPLPRGRRVSVKSPEAIRMEIEEGEDEMKRDLVKEIVKTPGVALRSTSRRARATPAPLPTPVPASSARATARRAAARKIEEIASTLSTLRRSQRTAARKGAGTVEVDQSAEDVSAVKRTTRSARSKVAVALDKEDNVAAAASKEGKVLQEERKAVASDVKCDDPEDGEVTKLLDGDNKEEEPEEGDEADSSHAAIRYAVVLDENCDGPMLEEVAAVMEMEEQSTKPHEEIVEEQEPISVEKSAPLTVMDDSPILGVLSKVEAAVPAIKKEEIVAVDEEAIKENEFSVTGETDPTPDEILPAAVEYDTREDDSLMEAKEVASDEVLQAELVDDGTSEEDGFTEVKEGAVDEMPQAELADDGTNEDDGFTEVKERNIDEMPQAELVDAETSEEDEDDGFTGVKEGAEHEVPQAELADDETSDDDTTELKEGAAVNMLQSGQTEDETSEEDDLDEDEEWKSDYGNSAEEIGSSIQSNEEIDETYEESYTAAVAKPTVLAVEDDEDASTEDDDFSSDLPPEFDNVVIYSDAETESYIAPPVLEENQAAKAEQQDFPEESDATEKAMKEVDNIVKSLDEFTFKEGEAKEMKQPQVEKYNDMSLRKLKLTLKNRLIALKEANEEVTEGKRLPLEEVDDNARVDC